MSLLKTFSCVLEFIPSTCSINPETTLACGIFAVTTQPSIVDVYDLRNTKTYQMCCSDTSTYLWKNGISLDTIGYPTQGRIQGGVWGAHAPPPPPPPPAFGTEPARNAEVCHAFAHVATLTQCTSLILYMNHCFMSCIHRAVKSAAPKLKRQFCGSASNTKADSEGKGLRETTIRRIA